MHAKIAPLLALAFAFALCGCHASQPGRVLAGDGWFLDPIDWSADELAADVAVREIGRSSFDSHHIVRLNGAEKEHIHDRHDLFVFVQQGKVRLHIENATYTVTQGDVIQIPHGTRHWAENIDAQPSIAYIIFSPPFDGDTRPTEPAK